jgi:S-DNA-T family DNA segregation ATPase FtsK/SpoIIIE
VTVRTYFIDHDAAMEIAGRAKLLRGPVQRLDDAETVRDLVADVADALGVDEVVKATDMTARLRENHPGYPPYRSLNGVRLTEMLKDEGVEMKETNGRMVVRRERVHRVLDDREDDQ